jgi:hypothetical protein
LIRLDRVRLSYPHLFIPRSFGGAAAAPDAVPKFSCSFLVPKSDQALLAKIQAAYRAAVAAKFPGQPPAGLTKPWQDGDATDADTGELLKPGEEFRGVVVLRTSSKTRPAVVNRFKQPAVEEDVWPGQYAHALVKFSGYTFGAKRGVSAYINAVMLTGEGDRIDGAIPWESAFADLGASANDAPFDEFDESLLGDVA